ncbi:uncharacterized protein TRIADDRAFT_54713 [Trichoplax adhaerens]|uniref:Serine/threonine-protein kinase ATR n=1 Tax=Trichoplax adhaerens TaxID=10228 RepID=B3RSS6_TRIAD|nr:hypothetical protein TRIADDRAFT_54713 [Trichoplax adhaerens]EDV26576.1 hypothetical protein TRIADDRAFT_54713 [Trichoplax adhaerens]|eukprot:XP_002110572.1 hypothetical protein TRIADDRAFT_54713 [Trichoplax adhaerens]
MGLFLLPHALIHALLDSSTKDVNEIRQEILTVMEDVNKESVHDASDFSQICAQAIFSALDHLTHWTFRQIRKAALAAKNKKEKDDCMESTALPVVNHEDVSNFLKSIPQDILANASYKCRANARALMHFETFARNNPDDLQRNLRFLQEIYVALDEPDGVAGVAAVSDDRNSFNKQVLEFESIGNLRDASACYECAIQLEPNELNHHKGLLQCLMGLGQLSTALAHVNGVISQQETWVSALNTYRVEASWRLANWDCLQDYLGYVELYRHYWFSLALFYLVKNEHFIASVSSDQDSNDWNVGLGRLLLNARDRNHEEFGKQLKIVRKGLMESFSASIMESGSLQQGYDSLVRLHMLHEVEDCVRLFLGISISNFRKIDEQVLLTNWNSRLQITQHSFKIREPLLNLRRVLLGFGNSSQQLKEQQGSCWLLSAKEARKAGYIQTAFSSLLNPCSFNLSGYHIEKAKLLWKQGGCSQALKCLKDAFSDKNIRINEGGMIDWGDKDGSFPSEEKVGHAKALLLVARWTEDTSHSNSHAVLKQYKNITEIRNQWELGHFYLAKYYDRFMKYVPDNKPARMLEFIPHVIKHYALSLQFGNKFIYESMPRLLTLWLDIGSKFSVNRVKSIDKTFLAVLSDVNKIISDSIEKLPPYKFFTAFSQLISRICHPNASIFDILEKIIAKLMVEYPQQSIWLMAAVSKSSYSVRRSRCHEIFAKAKSNCAELEKFINDATCLFDRLLDVCNMPVSRNCTTISLSENCRSLVRLTNDPSFSAIICPLQSSMTAILSSKIDSQTGPFPDNLPTIVRFKDKIDVLMSLQKPKKIVIRGSDGKEYMMMCKPKDDLRKDSRLMEFNSLINKAVVPLNEECGILEWVNNTAGLRHILLQLYKEKGILCTGRELKNLDANADKYGYQSRLAYARTVAVMSVVGYVLGLGDRHGENILFDSTSGDAVHVDFSCLFNKGKTFDCPEVVPFRLTHNMIDAMGPTGYEGIYRRACEVTMRVMRNQCDPLMTVLKTFVHDPLVEWGKIRRNDSNRDHAEITNELALKIVKDVEDRLKGNTSKSKGPALSVEGQVHELVKEATDVNNLSQMYIGWAAYM